MRHNSRSRRQFLKLMGSAGTMAGFSRLLWPSVSEAATGSPLRFCAFFTIHGKVPEYWTPQGGEMDFNIDFEKSVLRPLQPYRSKVLVLDGLDYRVLYEYGSSGHEGGPVAFLTGSRKDKTTGEDLPRSESIDQYLANQLGQATKFRSLQLNPFQAFGSQSVYNTVSFGTGGTRVPWERNPRSLFTRIFAGLTGAAPNMADVRAAARKKSLLDYLVKDATRLRDRLASIERDKLDKHLEALRDIERRIDSMAAPTTCSPPAAPTNYNGAFLDNPANVPTLTQVHLDLLSQAFACDLTRFATVTLLPSPNMPWVGLTESIHDDLAHRIDATDPTEKLRIRTRLATAHTWFTEQIARFMGSLDAVKETGGASVLDNSLILWGNELGDPSGHSNLGVPTVIAGGVAGKWRMGRYLNLRPGLNPIQGWREFGDKTPNAVPHNKLLVSVAQAFDQNITTFGQPDYVGPLTGLV